MTLEEAKKKIPDYKSFANLVCLHCESNEWDCGEYCSGLKKGQQISFERIQQSYAKNDGDTRKVCSFIKTAKK